MLALPILTRGARPSASAVKDTLVDPFGRTISYMRVSVTDRCDLRCTYCMAEHMTFLPRDEVLSLAELERLCLAFIALGVTKLRLTGGEPLTRRGLLDLVGALTTRLGRGLDELTLTTNGTRLAQFARPLADAGVRRINVSLDTRDPDRYRRLTRGGDLSRALAGLDAADDAGLAIKINAVALAGENEAELPDLIAWAHGRGWGATLIETMPLGAVEEDRTHMFLPLSRVRRELEARWTLTEVDARTPGPARYVQVAETGGRLGFITPLTHNFCEGCNRVRLTCDGKLTLCLGQEDSVDLRAVMRGGGTDGDLRDAIRAGIAMKPSGHDFDLSRREPAVRRHMSATGG